MLLSFKKLFFQLQDN